ncbi:DNA-3-methyladenine glycosylase [Mangrovivirga sp. M17]|uniref:Putative 3-methyladenine DNA glycosylase n=1 Tax=Mangrovivirga halotolerans TaxID=2993936 RepID=A0ABT3RWX4_9BACT|nr:DNA-3-methyladenine glycosylase [Mangrovivirga halotolerans]MCX2746082.1 DNA-3-methyladenine glycosylase [Mangrovivirga halotolerans]
MEKLSKEFYLQNNVVSVAKQLLGKVINYQNDGILHQLKIVETEAYRGFNDKACHASGGMTKRNTVMFMEGGRCYIYLCYGIHHLFNIVTNSEGTADAILVRAVEPVNQSDYIYPATDGPGKWTKAIGLKKDKTGQSLISDELFLTNMPELSDEEIMVSTRIGVDYAGKDALNPWRFYINESEFVSKRLKEDFLLSEL